MLQSLFTAQNILFIPVFLIVISVLVAAHEYGHYIFARMFGMGVEEFAIGFGRKPIWTYKKKKYLIPLEEGQRLAMNAGTTALPDEAKEKHAAAIALRLESPGMHGEISSLSRGVVQPVLVDTPKGQAIEETTNFTIRPWPVGGFVRIKGMLPDDDGSETRVPGGFYSKAPWKRFIVLLAGPVFSVIAGAVLLFIVFATVGARDAVPTAGTVYLGSPAEAAGLKAGDKIVELDSRPVGSIFDVLERIRFGGEKQHKLVFEREGERHTTQIMPLTAIEESEVVNSKLEPTGKKARQAKIGIEWKTEYVRMSLSEAGYAALVSPVRAVVIMGYLLSKPSELKKNVGGPIAIIQQTRSAVEQGPIEIIGFAAMLSISVGIFNLLPIPPLDGGQMAIAVAEMFRRGRRLSMRVQNWAAAAGVFMVLLMFLMVFTLDIQRLGQPNTPKFSDVVQTKSAKPKAQQPKDKPATTTSTP